MFAQERCSGGLQLPLLHGTTGGKKDPKHRYMRLKSLRAMNLPPVMLKDSQKPTAMSSNRLELVNC